MNTQAPHQQLRRLRQQEAWRAMIRETRLSPDQLVMPLFVRPGSNIRAPIPAMPGQFQLSIDQLVKECQDLYAHHVPAVLLFGLADRKKDELAKGAYAGDGLMQRAIAAVKASVPKLLVISDVCLCAYTSHGHCGILKRTQDTRHKTQGKMGKKRSPVLSLESRVRDHFWIDNEATCETLAKVAVSHAQAGVDMVAPSDMMDGSVRAIRSTLDKSGHSPLPIMAYAAKFASALYAPFRTAVDSSPAFGDRRSYQLDPANSDEALRKARHDFEDGADVIMVKPATGYLDIVRRVKDSLRCPTAAFSVSGEYAMVKAAAARGWISETPVWIEMLLGMKRAGADVLITYWAKEAAILLQKK